MRHRLVLLACLPLLAALAPAAPGPPAGARLLLAFASYRERPRHPKIYFYEHDGIGQGKLVGSVEGVNQRSDYHPTLSRDGRWCAFAAEVESQTMRLILWDRMGNKAVELPGLNDTPNAVLRPSLSGDGGLLAYQAWNRPGAGSRWAVLLYDVAGRKPLDRPRLLARPGDERMPALSADGRMLAFTSNAPGGAGLTDIHLFDRPGSRAIDCPGLNSPHMDVEPSLSADGQMVAFVSDRPGGSGGRDVYLFDRSAGRLIPLPGLNAVGHEQSPALSPDGRFLAFVSERLIGAGERDIYLYDRQAGRLLPTPGLNSPRDDLDPCLIVLGEGR